MEDERFERLELKLAYLEAANEELGAVVYRQQREIAELRQQVVVLGQRLMAMPGGPEADPVPFDPEAERPPHY